MRNNMFSNDDVVCDASGGGGSCVAMMGWARLIRCCFSFARSASYCTTDLSDVAGTMNILRKEEKDPFELLAIVSKIARNLSSEKVRQQSYVRR